MPRTTYLQRLAAPPPAAAGRLLLPARQLFAPRSLLPEVALEPAHEAPHPAPVTSGRAIVPAPDVSAPESPRGAVAPMPALEPAPSRTHASHVSATDQTTSPARAQRRTEVRPAAETASPEPPVSATAPAPIVVAGQAIPVRPEPSPIAAVPSAVTRPAVAELAPPPPERPTRAMRESTDDGSDGVRIGHLEVRILAPPAPPVRPAPRRPPPRPPATPLARGFRSFGLAQI
jgi:hypothetical protein